MLAWREAYAAQQVLKAAKGISTEEDARKAGDLREAVGHDVDGLPDVKLPTILYASRTHSQLTQAMHELKRMPYAYSLSLFLCHFTC